MGNQLPTSMPSIPLLNEEKAKSSFDFFDTSKIGQIEGSQLRGVLKKALPDKSDLEIQVYTSAIMKAIDKNDDGKITWDELKAIVIRK